MKPVFIVFAALVMAARLCGLSGASEARRYASAQAAAANVFYAGTSTPRAVRTNVVGSYAIAEIRGGSMEGQTNSDAVILLKRYSFGWQAVDTFQSPCAAKVVDQLPPTVRARLLRGMPVIKSVSPECARDDRDIGPVADVAAVRAQEDAPFVPYAVVIGDYAVTEHYGAGGGDSLYRHEGKAWKHVAGGGGAMSGDDLRLQGVPASDVCKFPIYNCSVHAARVSPGAAAVVRTFYELWNHHRLHEAYALLSNGYRAAHPYAAWERSHSTVVSISTKTMVTGQPMAIGVEIVSTDHTGSGTVTSRYVGTWTVATQSGAYRLDRVTLTEAK